MQFKDYRILGFTTLQNGLIAYYPRLNISDAELLLIIQLEAFSQRGESFPSNEKIAANTNLSITDVGNLIQRLIDCNDHESAYEFTLEIMKKLGDNTPISPELCTQITRLQAEDNSKLLKLVEKRAKRADESQRCCLNRALGYLYVRNNDFAKAAEAFKEVTACPTQLQPNDVMMASYVFEQAGDKEAAEKIRQDSLKSAMSIQDKPAEIQTEVKTDEEPTALIAKRD